MEQALEQGNHRIGGVAGWIIAAVQSRRSQRAAPHVPVALRTLQTISMGGRRQIAVVECDGQRFLVGMSADAVTAIAYAPEAVAEVHSSPVVAMPQRFGGGF